MEENNKTEGTQQEQGQEQDQEQKETKVENTQKSLSDLIKENKNLEKELSSIVDKRVTDALKKQEKKFEEEKRKLQMSEDERKLAEQKQIEEERQKKETEIKVRELKLDLIDVIEEEGLDTSFRELIDVSTFLTYEKDEALEQLRVKVKKVRELFNKLVDKQVESIKKEYLKGKSPENINNGQKQVDSYEDAKKRGDILGMLNAKFNK